MAQDAKSKTVRLICYCNGVTQEEIEVAIARGCNSVAKVGDATLGGVGSCGGSCQPTIRKMCEIYQETGAFPENPKHPSLVLREQSLKKTGGS